MTQKERKNLQACSLFFGISEEETDTLLGYLAAEEARFAKNEIIWHMGDRISACALVLSGCLRAESVSPDGTHTLAARHGPGALVGDVLMATPGSTSPVYVIAAADTHVLFLSYRTIMGSGDSPALAQLRENLLAEIAEKYWAQRRRIGYLAEKSLRRRIALYLLDQRKGRSAFSLGISREDLADYLCVNRSALSRELGRMQRDGLLEFYRDSFRIPDPERLSSLK